MAIYSDERAVPYLLEALDRFEIVESENPLANHALIELRAAIEELGGTLTAEQQLKCRRGREPAEVFRRKMEALLASRRRDVTPIEPVQPRDAVPIVPARRRDRPGRNDPCWCGSGKKYKKCCLASDERGTFTDGAR
ncbi:MAG: SEC-C metal-binding domain-containing protein [Myxococcota bacterium]